MEKHNLIELKDIDRYRNMLDVKVWGSEENHFKLRRAKSVKCERYGGFGIGRHGGGARSVILDDLQVKGSGLTPLAGITKNLNYAHGTLTLNDAVLEVIYSGVLDRLLPHGVIPCRAIYYTGKEGSFEYDWRAGFPSASLDESIVLKKTHGAILIRDNCNRPAHYMRAGEFDPKDIYAEFISADLIRIRNIIKDLDEDGAKNFISTIVNFLTKCADQFSFSWIAGLMHGGISPSNISVEGAWLDLATSTFIDRGKDFLIVEYEFSNEYKRVESIIKEWVYTFSKYSGKELGSRPLIELYNTSFNEKKAYHFPYILGLARNKETMEVILANYCRSFTDICKLITPSGRTYGVPEIGMANAFHPSDYICGMALTPDSEIQKLYRDIYSLNDRPLSFNAFLTQALLKCTKRDYLASKYYKNDVEENLELKLECHAPELFIDSFIETYISDSEWIFSDEFYVNEVVYRDSVIDIFYDTSSNSFKKRNSSGIVSINVVSELEAVITGNRNSANRIYVSYLNRIEFIYSELRKYIGSH